MRAPGEGCIYQRGGRWWIAYSHHNRQFRESAGATEASARKLLKLRLKEILTERFVAPEEKQASVVDLIDDLMLHLRTKGAKSVGAFESHARPVREFFPFTRAADVTTAAVSRFVDARLRAGKAPATVNRETGVLRQAFNLAARQTPPRLSRVPYIPMLKEDNARQGFFERHEFEAVCAHLAPHVADIARFAYLSGWRKGEIVPLRWDAVDLHAREVRLRTSKSGHPRTLPLTGELWNLIQRRLEARAFTTTDGALAVSDHVFHAGDGRAVVDFKHSWIRACQKAGCPGKLFHDLRRTAIRDMIRAGVPQSVAMRISGHRTAAVFLRYDITSEDDKRAALQRVQEHRQAQPVRERKPRLADLDPPALPLLRSERSPKR